MKPFTLFLGSFHPFRIESISFSTGCPPVVNGVGPGHSLFFAFRPWKRLEIVSVAVEANLRGSKTDGIAQ
jgi:hypothetical protein